MYIIEASIINAKERKVLIIIYFLYYLFYIGMAIVLNISDNKLEDV